MASSCMESIGVVDLDGSVAVSVGWGSAGMDRDDKRMWVIVVIVGDWHD